MIVALTGHRPDKTGGYGPRARALLTDLAVDRLQALGATSVVSGMALGWDTAGALAALTLGLPLTAAVPCPTQADTWPSESQSLWRFIISMATHVQVVAPDYSAAAMQLRNRWMVDRCDHVLALWNGTTGGTKNCIVYAEACERPYSNAWPLWHHRTLYPIEATP